MRVTAASARPTVQSPSLETLLRLSAARLKAVETGDLNVGWRLRWIFFESFKKNSSSCVFFPVFLVGVQGVDLLPKRLLETGCWRCILRPPMSSTASRKCLCRNDMFHPDARNRRHQQYCAKDACRKASKTARQARWLAKPENRDYFRGSANCQRVRQWRLANPDYSRRKTTPRQVASQDVSSPQPVENKSPVPSCTPFPLQDDLVLQPALIVGLIAVLTGHVLQDDLVPSIRLFISCGLDILGRHAAHGSVQAARRDLSAKLTEAAPRGDSRRIGGLPDIPTGT